MIDTIEVFLQGPGIEQMVLVHVPSQGKVQDLIDVAREKGLSIDREQAAEVWLEDAEEPLALKEALKKAGVVARCRLQIHTCRRVEVTVNYNGKSLNHPFPPSATVGRVKKWAEKEFGLKDTDATEHFLQLCGTTKTLKKETHIGSLVDPRHCTVCFDLVPDVRIEG